MMNYYLPLKGIACLLYTSNFVRSLDAAKASLKSGNNTLILDKSSPIAQIFYGY